MLAETLGVLLFQEQAIRVAVEAAGFKPGEADLLRRALARNRSQEAMAALRDRFVRGAQEQGIEGIVAEAIFQQLAGFAGYGFCKSHAASFALIAYQTLWLKHYHAAAFYCALLNQQPMGFYPPEVLLGDARRHGVDALPPDVNHSSWRYTLEMVEDVQGEPRWALRTGLQTIAELGESAWETLAAVRENRMFRDLADFCRRTRLEQDVVRNLIRAGACDALGERRQLLWQLGDLDLRFGAFDLVQEEAHVELPLLAPLEQTAWEYELMGAAPARQMMVHYRPQLRAAGVLSGWQVKQMPRGRRARSAGFVVVRQRPATAKGILFMSLEDESGLLDLVVKPPVYARLRDVLRGRPLLIVEGIVQRSGAPSVSWCSTLSHCFRGVCTIAISCVSSVQDPRPNCNPHQNLCGESCMKRMRMLAAASLLLMVMVLAACGGEEATPTPAPPTAVPPTAAPAAGEATAEATVEATVEATAEATAETTLEATAEITAEATAEVAAEATVEATVEATSEITPEAPTEATTEATTGGRQLLNQPLLRRNPSGNCRRGSRGCRYRRHDGYGGCYGRVCRCDRSYNGCSRGGRCNRH